MKGTSSCSQALIALLALSGPACGPAGSEAAPPPAGVSSVDVVIGGDLAEVWETARETMQAHDVRLEPIRFLSSRTTFRLGDDEVQIDLQRADLKTPKELRTRILVRTSGPMSVTRGILDELLAGQEKAGRAAAGKKALPPDPARSE